MKKTLLASAAVVLAFSAISRARADDTATLNALRQQITLQQQQLAAQQKQIDALIARQGEIEKVAKEAKNVSAETQAAQQEQTARQAEAAPQPRTASDGSSSLGTAADRLQDAIQKSTGAKVSLGLVLDATTIYRTKNQGTDVGSNFNTGIPFNNSPNAHQSEFRETARNSRISLAATGSPDADTTLSAFVDTDFLGTAYNSSPVETSSYTPRLKQAWLAYESNDWGLHFLAGQAYSLATQNVKGIAARQELMPITPDLNAVPGTIYTRQPQLRVVKDFDDKAVTVGLSLETPSTNFPVSSAATGTSLSPYNTNSGSSANIADAYSSVDIAPDVIAKIAFDPGFGHYELIGMGRTFHDRYNGSNNNVFAPSGGANAHFTVLDGKLDLAANVMAGEAIGRYGAAQLPDITYTPGGAIKPLTGFAALVGAVVHPTPIWDLFSYAGMEETLRQNYDGQGATAGPVGYGNYSLTTSTCYGPESSTACNAETHDVWQITGGGWRSFYNGGYGKFQVGLQDSFTRRNAFSGVGGTAPHATENITMLSLRYTPKF